MDSKNDHCRFLYAIGADIGQRHPVSSGVALHSQHPSHTLVHLVFIDQFATFSLPQSVFHISPTPLITQHK